MKRAVAGVVGFLLAGSLSGCFSAPPQIVTLEPNRGSTSVPADTPVRVVFDKPVQRQSVVGRFSVSPPMAGCDLTAAFHAPGTAGCWVAWLPGDTGFVLYHENAVFTAAVRYEFTLSGGFTDSGGDHNGLDHHWDLTAAAAPRVNAFTPSSTSTDVPVDSPLAVSFNAPMDATSTANAISLAPSVPGTRVVQNASDHGRFVVLPGHLLAPGTTYTVSVGPGARGEDNQVLAASTPTAARFVTGSRVSLPHAGVLAAVPGEAPTVVVLPALSPAAAGEPAAAPVVVEAARCATVTPCGGVAPGAPLESYASAQVAADGSHIAMVTYAAVPPASEELDVVDAVHRTVEARVPGGMWPSWSATGAQLAYTVGDQVAVYNAVAGTRTIVATSTRLLRAPLWAGASSLVLSTAGGGAPGGGTLSVVDLTLDARYTVPAAPPGVSASAAAPNGSAVAVTATDGSVSVLALTGTAAPVRLGSGLTPIGFAGPGTLLAVSFSAARPAMFRVDLVGTDVTSVGLPASADLATVQLNAGGRRVVFLGFDPRGVFQAYAANADGSATTPLTRFGEGVLEAVSIAVAP